ncbi:MAG: DedA family protein [Rhodospirillales bacterium]|nr:DedA family protein [Rhodospirillales bacterium]
MELDWLLAKSGAWPYLVTFCWTFFEGETFVLIAGFLASQKHPETLTRLLDWRLLVTVAWLGSFLGDQCYFWLGRQFGPRLLRRLPRWREPVDNALGWLKRYNTGFILSFRFIYGIRNFASFAMGMSGLDWRRFLVLNFLAAGIWAVSFVSIGMIIGSVFKEVIGIETVARHFTLIVLGVLVFMFGAVYLVHRIQRRRMRLPAAAAQASPPN